MGGKRIRDAEAAEAQETMLSGDPIELGGDGDADEAVFVGFFDVDVCFLTAAVLEDGSSPGVEEAGDVYGGGGDEVVPV